MIDGSHLDLTTEELNNLGLNSKQITAYKEAYNECIQENIQGPNKFRASPPKFNDSLYHLKPAMNSGDDSIDLCFDGDEKKEEPKKEENKKPGDGSSPFGNQEDIKEVHNDSSKLTPTPLIIENNADINIGIDNFVINGPKIEKGPSGPLEKQEENKSVIAPVPQPVGNNPFDTQTVSSSMPSPSRSNKPNNKKSSVSLAMPYHGFNKKILLQDSLYFSVFIPKTINPIEEFFIQNNVSLEENFLNFVSSMFFPNIRKDLDCSYLLRDFKMYAAKNKINLWKKDLKLIFYGLLNSVSPNLRTFLLRSFSKSNSIPLIRPSWTEDIKKYAMVPTKELLWIIDDAFLVTSIGLGSAMKMRCGKSTFLDKIFVSNFCSAEKHGISTGNIEMKMNIFQDAIPELVHLVDIESNANEEFICRIKSMSSVLIQHIFESEENEIKIIDDFPTLIVVHDSNESMDSASFEERLDEEEKNGSKVKRICIPSEPLDNDQVYSLRDFIFKFIYDSIKANKAPKFNKPNFLNCFFDPKERKSHLENYNLLSLLLKNINDNKNDFSSRKFLSLIPEIYKLCMNERLKEREEGAYSTDYNLTSNLCKKIIKSKENLKNPSLTHPTETLLQFMKILNCKNDLMFILVNLDKEIKKIVSSNLAPYKKALNNISEISRELNKIGDPNWNEFYKKAISDLNGKSIFNDSTFKLLKRTFKAFNDSTFPKRFQDLQGLIIKQQQDISLEIEKRNFSLEMLWREIMYFYKYQGFGADNESIFASFRDYVNMGAPFEILDGDNFRMASKFLKKAFNDSKNRLLVISVIGPQSSGKSTLLNLLLGCEFLTSSGRCTRGIYGTYIRIDDKNKELKEHYDAILVLDTEGLLSIMQNDDQTFDRKIALFCLSVSQVVIINVKGELNAPMKQLLNVCTLALSQLLDEKVPAPAIHIVLNQNSDPSIANHLLEINKVFDSVTDATKLAGRLLKEILSINSKNQIVLPSAFKIETLELKKLGINVQILKTEESFCKKTQFLAKGIAESAIQHKLCTKNLPFISTSNWFNSAKQLWNHINTFKSLVFFHSIKEFEDNKKLAKMIKEVYEKRINEFRNTIISQITSLEKSNELEEFSRSRQSIFEKFDTFSMIIRRDFEKDTEKKFDPLIIKNNLETFAFYINELGKDINSRLINLKGHLQVKSARISGDKQILDEAIKIEQSGIKLTSAQIEEKFNQIWNLIVKNMTEASDLNKSYHEIYKYIFTKFEHMGNIILPNPEPIMADFFTKGGFTSNITIATLESRIMNIESNFKELFTGCKRACKYLADYANVDKTVFSISDFYSENTTYYVISKYDFLNKVLDWECITKKVNKIADNVEDKKKLISDIYHSFEKNKLNIGTDVIESLLKNFNNLVFAYTHDLKDEHFIHKVYPINGDYVDCSKFEENPYVDMNAFKSYKKDSGKYTSLSQLERDYDFRFNLVFKSTSRIVINSSKLGSDQMILKKVFNKEIEDELLENKLNIIKHGFKVDAVYTMINNLLERTILEKNACRQLEGKLVDELKTEMSQILSIVNESLNQMAVCLSTKGLAHFWIYAIFMMWKFYGKENYNKLYKEINSMNETKESHLNYFKGLIEKNESEIDKGLSEKLFRDVKSEIDKYIEVKLTEPIDDFKQENTNKNVFGRRKLQNYLDNEIFNGNNVERIIHYLTPQGFKEEIENYLNHLISKPCDILKGKMTDIFMEQKSIYQEWISITEDFLKRIGQYNSFTNTNRVLKIDEAKINEIWQNQGSTDSSNNKEIFVQKYKKSYAAAAAIIFYNILQGQEPKTTSTENNFVVEFCMSQGNYLNISNITKSPFAPCFKLKIFESNRIYDFKIYLTYLVGLLKKHLNDLNTLSKNIDISKYDTENFFTIILKDLAIGCKEHCPTCGRVCDNEDVAHIRKNAGKHECSLGHFVRANIGNMLENGIASVKSCEEMAENDIVEYQKVKYRWKDFISSCPNWNFAEMIKESKVNPEKYKGRSARAKLIWDLVGKKIIEERFPNMGFVESCNFKAIEGGKLSNYHLIFVLDSSGSMKGVKWDKLKDALKDALYQVSEEPSNRATLISFSSEKDQSVVSAAPDIKNFLINNGLSQLAFFGNETDFCNAAKTAIEVMNKNMSGLHFQIFWISDGWSSYPEQQIAEILKFKTMDPMLTIRAIGIECDESGKKVLSDMANATGGTYRDCTAGNLKEKLFEILNFNLS